VLTLIVTPAALMAIANLAERRKRWFARRRARREARRAAREAATAASAPAE
jgi:multidrug efflux pump